MPRPADADVPVLGHDPRLHHLPGAHLAHRVHVLRVDGRAQPHRVHALGGHPGLEGQPAPGDLHHPATVQHPAVHLPRRGRNDVRRHERQSYRQQQDRGAGPGHVCVHRLPGHAGGLLRVGGGQLGAHVHHPGRVQRLLGGEHGAGDAPVRHRRHAVPVVLRPRRHHRLLGYRVRRLQQCDGSLVRHHLLWVLHPRHGGNGEGGHGETAAPGERQHSGVSARNVPGVRLCAHRIHLQVRHAAGGDDGRLVLRRRVLRVRPAAAQLPHRLRHLRLPLHDPPGRRARPGGGLRRGHLATVTGHVHRL
mmetsp:Transcript_32903/g.80988  ORF Transcript_32903/g.80988 Transcript_32903/m.80988 type:complete len:305 (-) Transcript_32903:608-1522(-)